MSSYPILLLWFSTTIKTFERNQDERSLMALLTWWAELSSTKLSVVQALYIVLDHIIKAIRFLNSFIFRLVKGIYRQVYLLDSLYTLLFHTLNTIASWLGRRPKIVGMLELCNEDMMSGFQHWKFLCCLVHEEREL